MPLRLQLLMQPKIINGKRKCKVHSDNIFVPGQNRITNILYHPYYYSSTLYGPALGRSTTSLRELNRTPKSLEINTLLILMNHTSSNLGPGKRSYDSYV